MIRPAVPAAGHLLLCRDYAFLTWFGQWWRWRCGPGREGGDVGLIVGPEAVRHAGWVGCEALVGRESVAG